MIHSFTVLTRIIAAAIALAGLALGAGSQAGEVYISTPGVGGLRFQIPVISLKEARFQSVFAQQFDFSCGSAALASLLTFHYDEPVTEAQVFEAMYAVGDHESIHTYGFSMLDMKKFLEAVGWKADGFKIPLEQLADVGVPAITLIETDGYKHFVIVKGIRGNEVLVGDPARGLLVVSRDEFEQQWNGIVFVIRENVEFANDAFNRQDEWDIQARAPMETALIRQGLSSFTMNLPGVSEF